MDGSNEEAVAVDNLHKAKKNLASAKATLDAAKAEVYAEGGEIDKDGNVVVKEEEDIVSLRGSRPKTAGVVSPTTEVTGDAARAKDEESYEHELVDEGQMLTREFDDINKAIDQMDQDINGDDYDAAKQDVVILKDLGTATDRDGENSDSH